MMLPKRIITKRRFTYLMSILFFAMLYACVEPYEFKSETYEKLLVIEGTLTNELKNQEIFLSSVYRIDVDTLLPESNANVQVIDDNQNTYEFLETDAGKYVSAEEFSISANRKYHLEITTAEGRAYSSEEEMLPPNDAVMSDLYAERAVNNRGVEGVAIYSSSTNASNTGVSFYKYTYKETYKIVSPFTSNRDLIFENGRFELVPKTREEEICYNTRRSNEILLADTGALSQNEISNYLIKFYEIDDFAIQNRYSILASQISINQDAYDYYETLKELSGSESIFSQNQPGFIRGNIVSLEDPDEKVIGNFNLGKVSSKRIFFNFTDFFNLAEKPDATRFCEITRPKVLALTNLVIENQVKFYAETFGAVADEEGEGPYRVVPRLCIDCTVFGTNIKPEFWIE